MRGFGCLLIGLLFSADARAESDAARVVAGLRERGEFAEAEQHGTQRWRRADISTAERADLAIQLALIYTVQALAAPPESRNELWRKADEICEWLIVMWEPLDETLGGRHDRDASETVDAGVAGERLLDHRTLIVKVDRSRGRGGSTMIQGRSESFGENHEPLRGWSYRSVV